MTKLIWALFGNDEDGVDGPSWFMPGAPLWQRRILWWWRNPLHNLVFHVWGVYGKPRLMKGRFPYDMFNPNGGLNWTTTTTVTRKNLPYVSLKFKGHESYIGWRPTSGAFGIAFRPVWPLVLLVVLWWLL